jgi:hypothetical protein
MFFVAECFIRIIKKKYGRLRPPLWASGQEFLATEPEVRVRFPALPGFLSSGSGTGSTQPRKYKSGATWPKK